MPDDLTINDIPLTADDIGQLVNADQVVHFFARLGYDVDESIPLDHAALGMDSETLRHEIRNIRLVGRDPEDADIVIYLFEVRSVTVALTQTIARRFRERMEYAFLVLTADYENLDFVLVEREVAAGKKLGGGLKQVIRPRTLSVDRRNPTPVQLRVLRRFTFTEADGLYQWEKLRSAFTLAEWSEQYFNNRALFSDYYLKERLPDARLTPAWDEDVRPVGREVLRHLADARRKYSGKPEASIRQGLYEPLFTSLGFRFEVNKTADSDLSEPDYILYAPDRPDKPVAAALTYVWNRNLDDEDPQRDAETPREIPGALVVNVLEKAQVDWVMVTNGKLWRLYSTTAPNKATNYYEIDLEEAVMAANGDQITALKYWWLFFRRDAFTGFLDDLLQKSADYARSLGERLKGRVFTSIFPHFAAGFIADMRSQGVDDISPDDLGRVYTATMTFLYRLMFTLYAESLELLPVYETRGYGEFSLYGLKKTLAEKAGAVEDEAPERLKQTYAPDSYELYERLQLLFHAIDKGDRKLNLPMYNGGLFNDESDEGKFLAEYAIPDRYLALGLDRLCRDVDDKTQALAMIDYKSLGVRHLGSIYEGLLEFKLKVAPEPLVVVKEKKKEVYLPAARAGRKRVIATLKPGDVYLENDKRERKATGSYYTPDYIVKYIVEQTVGPVLERKFEALAPRLREAQKRYRQHRKTVEARGNDQSPELFWRREDMQRLADDCLDIKVLDPAMGSGHFLVEAVDFISNRLIGFLNAWSENPVWALLERTRADILEDMERQQVSIDADKLTRVALLKRSVLKRCIYGVDLNEMAVELAKVSLWLDAFTLGAPLSFLDHHLKWGNSLIGARIQEVQEALGQGQLSLFAQSKFAGVMLATDLMRLVSYLSDNTVDQLEESRSAFRSARDHLAPYKRMLDVYTSRWFGNFPNIKKKNAIDPTVEFLHSPETEAWLEDPAGAALPAQEAGTGLALRRMGETALRVAQEKRFFHWELEFPEVFFAPSSPGGQDVQLREDGGFDAVVGNPPYDELSEEELGRDIDEIPFWEDHPIINMALGHRVNLYRLFVAKALELLQHDCFHGFIVPLSILADQFTLPLRRYVLRNVEIIIVEEFPQKDDPINRVFLDAKLSTCVYIFRKRIPSNHTVFVRTHPGRTILPDSPSYRAQQTGFEIFDPINLSIPGVSQNAWNLLWRLATSDCYTLFGNYVHAMPGELMINRQFRPYLTDIASGEEIIRGSHIGLYELVTPKQGETLYVNRAKYLQNHQNSEKAFHHRRSRVVYQRYAAIDNFRRLISTILPGGYFCSHTVGYLIGPSDIQGEFFVALLNSKLLDWRFNLTSTNNNINGYEIEALPIPKLLFQTAGIFRVRLADQARALYQRSLSQGFASVLDFVAEQLAAEPERSDVVHDLLAFLAERMIELNKRKQAEVKRFLGWLEGRLQIRPDRKGKTGIDSLAGKSIIRNYLGDYQKGEKELPWEDFYYRLHRNRNRFGVNLGEIQGEIQAEYERSLATLLPIKRQLAYTDGLIDQIVYKLYGLSDEEIAIIEGPAYEQALSQAKAAVVKDSKLQADPEAAAEVMAGTILPAAQRLRQQVQLSEERRRLDADLPGWHLFPDEVATFLVTAEYNLRTLPGYLDFSTSVVSYAKAVEAMLYHRVFVRFRVESGATDADCKNSFLQQFMRGERHLTLGSMAIILKSSKEAALRAFVQRLYPRAAETFFGPGGLAASLQDERIISLRNRAAHDESLSREDARSARAWALGILSYL